MYVPNEGSRGPRIGTDRGVSNMFVHGLEYVTFTIKRHYNNVMGTLTRTPNTPSRFPLHPQLAVFFYQPKLGTPVVDKAKMYKRGYRTVVSYYNS